MITQMKKFDNALIGFFLVFLVGIGGYMYLESYSLLNAFYMTSITLGTVGFSEVVPLTAAGKIFTSFLIFAGISVYIYCISTLTSLIVEGEIKNFFKDVKMNKIIKKLENHFIIVGYGRTGEKLVENFYQAGEPFVIIEKDPENIQKLRNRYPTPPLFILGDATEDAVLQNAGLEKAKTIMPVLADDTTNLFVTMSARLLNSQIKIVTRLNDNANYAKLKKAGANKILSSFDVAADRIYSMAMENNLLSFQDMVDTYKNAKDLNLARVMINENCEFRDKKLMDASIPRKIGLIVIGIERDGELALNPKADTIIRHGDRLVVMGNINQIKTLENMCCL